VDQEIQEKRIHVLVDHPLEMMVMQEILVVIGDSQL
jgi:hypothetical protein